MIIMSKSELGEVKKIMVEMEQDILYGKEEITLSINSATLLVTYYDHINNILKQIQLMNQTITYQ